MEKAVNAELLQQTEEHGYDSHTVSASQLQAEEIAMEFRANVWRKKTQVYFLWVCALAFMGIILAVAVNEIMWWQTVGFEAVDTVLTTSLKISIFVTSGAAVIFLYLYYDGLVQMTRFQGMALDDNLSIALWESGLGWYFFIDVLTLLPMEFPFIHFTLEVSDLYHEETPCYYTSESILMICMFLRLQFLPRFIAELWKMRHGMVFLSARQHNVVVDTWFIIRAQLIDNFATLIFLITCVILADAYIVMIVERAYPHVDQLSEFENALYFTIITMTTVGYGDISPDTRLGRAAAVLVAFQGMVFFALIINGVVERVSLNPTETRIVDFVTDSKLEQDTRQKAAMAIQTTWRQYKNNIASEARGKTIVLVKMHPNVLSSLSNFTSALRAQNLSGLDVNTEKTYRGIDAIQDRIDDLEHSLKKTLALNQINMEKIMQHLKI